MEENEKHVLMGNWSTVSTTDLNLDLSFFKDSCLQKSFFDEHYTTKWKVEKNKLILYQHYGSLMNRKNILDYKFNGNKDTLYLKHENDSLFEMTLRKINNGFEYFKNKIGIEIELTKTENKTISAGENDYNFDIYIGIKNNKIISKTNYSNNLNKLSYDVINFLDKVPEEKTHQVKYTLFIDKNIPNQKIDSIKSMLNNELIERIFIVTNYKENKWNEPINWLGFYEK